ncbi:MAG: hypothetical protein AAF696_19925 [Bacteroidota bacterium]
MARMNYIDEGNSNPIGMCHRNPGWSLEGIPHMDDFSKKLGSKLGRFMILNFNMIGPYKKMSHPNYSG